MNGRRTRRITEASPPLRVPEHAAGELLELLTYSGWPLTLNELRQHGIATPAQTIYELQLAGYEIDRVPVHLDDGHLGSGYRLHLPPPDEPAVAASAPSRPAPRESRVRRSTGAARHRASRRLASPN